MELGAALLGLVAALCWGGHDFAGRFAARTIGQLVTTLGVMLAGFVVLAIYHLGYAGIPAISAAAAGLAALTGAAYAVATLALFSAYRIGSMSIVSPLVGTYPALVVVFSVLAGARPSLVEWLAMAVVMIGTAIVSACGEAHEDAGHIVRGKLPAVLGLSALSATGFAVAIIAGQRAAPEIGEAATTWLARGFAVAVLLPMLALRTQRSAVPVRWWPVLTAMGLLDTTAMLAIVAAGHLPGAEIAAVTGGSFGAVVAILAAVFLKEPVTARQGFGIFLIIAGTAALVLA